MASAADWLYRADWSLRSPEFGVLGTAMEFERAPRKGLERVGTDRVVTMSLSASVTVADALWERWIHLPHHRVLLRVNRPGLLRFAAIDWRRRGFHVGGNSADDVTIAGWGYQIADALTIVHGAAQGQGAWFACPLVQLDLEGEVRMAFVSPSRDSWPTELLPPELAYDWPRCDERAFVFAAAQALKQLVTTVAYDSALGAVIARATDLVPANRYQSLAELMTALRELGAQPSLRNSIAAPRTVWNILEQGLGFMMLGDRRTALQRFQRAVDKNPHAAIGRDLRDVTEIPQDQVVSGAITVALPPWPLQQVEPIVQRHAPVPEPPVPRVFAYSNGAIARSVLSTATLGPTSAPSSRVDHLLRSRDYRGALELVDAQLAATPDDARTHHLRGKALFALGRLPDARAAFDRACTLDARLLEAMLLRREMDRAMKDAGTANRVALKLPDHLAELRDILVAGRIVDAIQLLRRAAYDDDRTAQLLLAELLVTDERLEDALAIFERLGDPLGKARTLLALTRPAEALLAIDASDADEALEVRSRILIALDRGDDAERAMDAYLRTVERRSDRRLESRGPESRAGR